LEIKAGEEIITRYGNNFYKAKPKSARKQVQHSSRSKEFAQQSAELMLTPDHNYGTKQVEKFAKSSGIPRSTAYRWNPRNAKKDEYW